MGRWPPSEEQPEGEPGVSPTFLQTFVADWAPATPASPQGVQDLGYHHQGHAETGPDTPPEAMPHLGWCGLTGLRGSVVTTRFKETRSWAWGSGIHLPHLSFPVLTPLGPRCPAFFLTFPFWAVRVG